MKSTSGARELGATTKAGSWLRGLGLLAPASLLALLALGPFVVLSAISTDAASQAVIGLKDGVVRYFDWLFVAAASLALALVATLALHPRANVRLGPDDGLPDFRTSSWFAMLFSAGLASGLLYWATAEPVLHFQQNPFLATAGIDAASSAAVLPALRITIFHWGLHGWAFYVIGALAISIASYRHGQPLTFRSALFPLFGARWIHRWPGMAVDGIALLGTLCGVATSIGLAAAAMNATLSSLFGLAPDLRNQLMIVFGVCMIGILSALSGVAHGVRRLSEINVWISLLLLGAVAFLGPTEFLAKLSVRALSDYAFEVLPLGIWIASDSAEQVWQSAWTVFYWGWWLAWMPFVSLFIARISRGRTVRQFVLGVMLVPSLVIVLWMAVFGGTALHQELADPGSVSTPVNQDYSLGTVTVLENLGHPELAPFLVATAALLLFTWLVTSLDSATLVITHLLDSENVAQAKVFWGVMLAAVTCTLMLAGGLPALQAASIVMGLPLAALTIAIGLGLVRTLLLPRNIAPARDQDCP